MKVPSKDQFLRNLQAGGELCGKVKVPGDKSISHRALLFGAIAEGKTIIEGLLPAEDPLSTAIFVLSLFNTMISAMISFSQMESKIARHHDNKLMFGDLELDLNAFLLDKNNDYNNYKNQEILMTEKEKMCRSAEQGNLFCFGV